MHKNAESTIGRQSQEVGVWRKLVQDLGTAQVAAKPDVTKQEEALLITAEDILRDPTAAIAKVVKQQVAEAIKPVTQRVEVSSAATEFQQLKAEFPKLDEWGRDPKFLEWSYATPTRRVDADATVKGDPKAARRLLEAWNERVLLIDSLKPAVDPQTQQPTQQQQPDMGTNKPQGLAGARQAVTEAGGGTRANPAAGKRWSTKEITDMINSNPEHYRSDAFQAELIAAAREGRIG
jgi:hypothetical protein